VGPNGAALHALRHQGRLTLEVPKLAASLAHMHCIRLMSRHSRVHELVIYDFLRRLYRSQTARDGAH